MTTRDPAPPSEHTPDLDGPTARTKAAVAVGEQESTEEENHE